MPTGKGFVFSKILLESRNVILVIHFDFLFLQKDNTRNQRENLVLSVANAQARLGIPVDPDPVSVWIIGLVNRFICS